jgi:ATP-binding cassette subfamily F protein 3
MWRDRQSRRQAEAEAVAAEEKARQDAAAKKQRAAAEAERQRQQKNEPANNALARMNQKKLESEIERIESRIKAIDQSMNDPDVWSNPKKCEELGGERSKLAAELEPLEFEWMRRADEQEASV